MAPDPGQGTFDDSGGGTWSDSGAGTWGTEEETTATLCIRNILNVQQLVIARRKLERG